MSWRDQLQPASFRGVAFLVESGDAEFGRRTVSIEYPYRDNPFVDDMGRRQRVYNIEAFILDKGEDGPDLFDQRNALIDALETAGAALLIHPRLGALRVQVDRARWRTDQRQGSNVERFSITFVEAGDDSQPEVATDTLSEVTVTASAVHEAQAGALDKLMAIKNQADFVVQSARDEINRGMTGVKKLVRIGTAAADSVAGLTQTIDSAIADIGNLILTPRTLAASVAGIVNLALNLDGRIDTIMDGYRSIGALWGDVDPIPQTTPSRVTQTNNQAAIAQLFAVSATVEAARLVSQQAAAIGVTSNAQSPFKSADEAYAVRDELVAALDAIALTADDDTYSAIVDLQSALVSHIDAHGNAMPRITRLQFSNVLPMVIIAHRIYGDATRDSDLIARNRIKHPLFVRAGQPLEVLNG